MTSKCAGCLQVIKSRQYLCCCICAKYYLLCANVSEQRFRNTLTGEHRLNWKCAACICSEPKVDNSDTPVRGQDEKVTRRRGAPAPSPVESGSCDDKADQNITQRHRTKPYTLNETSIQLDVDEITGDTQIVWRHSNHTKLEKVKKSILTDLKEAIQSELTEALKKFQKFQIDSEKISLNIQCEQRNLKAQISIIDNKIKNIESQLENLDDTKKKIVLYGLQESRNENNNILYDYVNNIFIDIMDLNINPYIENIKRIGRKGNRRPLEIEFISKRFTKYVIENSHCFRNTGLGISTYMTGEKLRQSNMLKQKLQEARKTGCHAIIRQNKLFINGKLYEQPLNETQSGKTK
ncbi:hypothetical protein ACJJTC_001461 [Scirpophaga incertulas]